MAKPPQGTVADMVVRSYGDRVWGTASTLTERTEMPQVIVTPESRMKQRNGQPAVSLGGARRRPGAPDSEPQKQFEFRLFLTYCGIFYLVPFTLFQFLGNPLEDSFRPRPFYALGFAYVVASVLIFRLMQRCGRLRFRAVPHSVSRALYGAYPALALSCVFLGLSVWSFINLGFQFRQTGDTLTEVGSLGFLLVFGKVLMGTSIIVHYRMIKEGIDPNIRSACLLLISLGFAINNQSAFDVLFSFAAYVAATHRIRRVFHLTGKPIQIASLAIFPILIVLIFFAGKANKVGVEETLYIISHPELFLNAFLERYSYAMYSVAMHVEENFFNFGLTIDAVKEVFSVMHFRASSLLGIVAERPDMGSTARMNFFFLADFYDDRIGISPSMLGSAFFFPGAGLSIIYYVLIIRFIFSLFWKVMGPTMDSWLFLILAVLLASTAIDALFDALNPLSNGFSRILTLYIGASFVVTRVGRRDGRFAAVRGRRLAAG